MGVVDEGQMTGSVPRGPDRPQIPAGQVQGSPVTEYDVHGFACPQPNEVDAGGREDVGGRPELGELGVPQLFVGGGVLRRMVAEQCGIRAVHRERGPADLPQPGRKTEVVGMQVGDGGVPDVGDVVPGLGDAVDEGSPRLLGIPAHIDQGEAVGQRECVDQDVAQRVSRHRHRDRPQSGAYLLDRRQDAEGPRLALDGTDVFGDDHDGTSVARSPLAQGAFEDLAARSSRKFGDVDDLPRLLVRREPGGGERDQVLLVRLVRRIDEPDDRRHGLTPRPVRHADHRHLGHRRMLGEHRFDLDRVHVLASRDDHVLHPVGDEQVALPVDVPGVAGAQETVGGVSSCAVSSGRRQ